MVKGVSKQVIVVHSPDKKLFDQAIFILSDQAVGQEGITDEALLKEAKLALRGREKGAKRNLWSYGAFWSAAGAALTGGIWLLTAIL